MAREQLKTLTEPMYYLLLTLIQPQHGYGIMQSIAEMTDNQVQVGAGTLYALLSRFEGEGIIAQIMEKDRKKIYQITPKGAEVLTVEFCRLNRMVEDGRRFFDSTGGMLPINYVKACQGETQEMEETAETHQEKPREAPEQEAGEGGKSCAPGASTGEEKESGAREEKKEKQEKQEKTGKPGFRGFRKGIFAT